ncbi:MAG: outer membrane beta-barrel domain-containing protein [Deltaproteobacteria bacterium]|nr:MAG: outer membrane beta-barrel domain-containing protein [Deltaproteobacteria bacterium]
MRHRAKSSTSPITCSTSSFQHRFSRQTLFVFWIVLLLHLPQASATCPQPAQEGSGNDRRGPSRRLFVKTMRHEIAILGGTYSSDLLGTSLAAYAGYTFHVNEWFGLEASYLYSYLTSTFSRTARDNASTDMLAPQATNVYMGSIVWYPIHGKMQLLRGAIPHFDIFLSAGVGVTNNRSSTGLTYTVGAGMKVFATSWLSVRVQLQDLIGSQRVLGEESLVNNIVFLVGVGFWFPGSS